MAEAVSEAFTAERHLLVQAGTGTGKSLAYLVPALRPRQAGRGRHRDAGAAAPARRARPAAAGRGGRRASPGSTRPTPCSRAARTTRACTASARACPTTRACWSTCPQGSMASKVLELRTLGREGGRRTRAPASATARRATPTASGARSASATATASAPPSAPSAQECFVELAREKAHRSHLIVTNHSLLAIDAIEGVPMIPDYDVAVIDEAHELTARVTQAATDELGAADVERAARRSQRHVDGVAGRRPRRRRRRAARRDGRGPTRAGSTGCPSSSPTPWCWCATPPAPASRPTPRATGRRGADAGLTQAKGSVQEVFATAERMAGRLRRRRALALRGQGAEPDPAAAVRRAAAGVGPDAREAAQRQDRRDDLGDADARRRLLDAGHQRRAQARRAGARRRRRRAADDDALPWTGLDVGSPFDYGQQAILYVARHLPPPGRDGLVAGPARRDRRARRRRRGPHPRALLEPPGRRGRRRGRCASGCRT